jgi:hypothetical protein
MKRQIVLFVAVAAFACGESPPAEEARTASPDSVGAAVADTTAPDSVMARDTARQLPDR